MTLTVEDSHKRWFGLKGEHRLMSIQDLMSVQVDLSEQVGALYYIPEIDGDGAEWNQTTAELWAMGWGISPKWLDEPLDFDNGVLLYALERIA